MICVSTNDELQPLHQRLPELRLHILKKTNQMSLHINKQILLYRKQLDVTPQIGIRMRLQAPNKKWNNSNHMEQSYTDDI